MLIHLRSIDGQPQITIDSEGEPLPCIETLPWRESSFRLSWPQTGGGGRDAYSGDPRATMHPKDGPAPITTPAPSGGRLGRFAAMTVTFAGFLVVGMMIGSVFRLGPSRGSELIPRDIAAPARGPDIPSIVAPPRSAEVAAPYPAPLELHVPVGRSESARVAAPPPQLPPPADPGALFGLHS
ncbi:MAG: hypothetical protein B7Z58_13200 [Acidiphilium sp. 37-64-53]|uniref:hypothetical protein n=1 Tax=Acidiphilium TaxID=522 RepID=UPI000BCD7EAB|nr:MULTISPECIES: hypothetical protein [Acidiphilium]OYW01033.1 MAG: hypothetical protein B7Z58_13200 [Acidiphilium sp. 37-64-53]HQT85044.1 hypothetical protein [Acidiphilium rubrum]